MSVETLGKPQLVGETPPLWFLGTLVRPKLGGAETGGRFALWEAVLPRGAAPPLHSHPQDETAVVLDGELTVWTADAATARDDWLDTAEARTCRAGGVLFAPAGVAHSFRVESDTARLLFLSVPAGIEEYVLALAEPARWPWLQPPPDGPRVPAARLHEIERTLGIIRHGPPPPTGSVGPWPTSS